jgi:hypothetical protein
LCVFPTCTGYFTQVAEQVGGSWLGWWMLAAAAVSQIGQFEVQRV